MNTDTEKQNISSIAEKGNQIYQKIKDKYDPQYKGKFLAIDVDSGDIFLGDTTVNATEQAKQKYPDKINEVRGIGLMAGVELPFEGQQVVDKMMEKNILVNCTNGNVIRLLPPLIITQDELDIFINAFETVIPEL